MIMQDAITCYNRRCAQLAGPNPQTPFPTSPLTPILRSLTEKKTLTIDRPTLNPTPRVRAPPPSSAPKPGRKGFYIATGIFLYTLTTYTVYQYTTLTSTSTSPLPTPETDVSSRYDTTAPQFDQDVSWIENTSRITSLRRRLTAQARGHVLEVSVGTGRNAQYYDLENVKTLAFVDQSRPMIDIAREKWRPLHPDYENCSFHTQSAMDALPKEAVPRDGFTTILQTMGICSTPEPAKTLAYLGALAHPTDGRILLLEHGRSEWGIVNWILDASAAKHADRHGCWFNRDVGRILEDSGLVIEKVERRQFGTLWYVEARPAPGGSGPGHPVSAGS